MYHWRKIAVVVAGLAVSGPTQAQAVLDVFGGEGACYSREYDKAHLDSHPGQRVEKIALWSTEEDPGSDKQVLQLYFRSGMDLIIQVTHIAATLVARWRAMEAILGCRKQETVSNSRSAII